MDLLRIVILPLSEKKTSKRGYEMSVEDEYVHVVGK